MHAQQASDDADRRNRFLSSGADTPRSASQPPRTGNGDSFLASCNASDPPTKSKHHCIEFCRLEPE